ncbi:hypothetical protein K458DRAFT_99667 [Lentithecium fluviatile CBS 122367]|uniref:HORMA domain-containing protein n=1 Tax=Lentithecium fluviatile CBS 122367 TaxID=1168545 RepID=A0A6G1JI79_9PLEO|nr:hypothetical protein K458DRAFT_99667 [Lentithecium fluviatile CBS 122367]
MFGHNPTKPSAPTTKKTNAKLPRRSTNKGTQGDSTQAQALLPAPAAIATNDQEVGITQSQSIELMQTFLYAGISSILLLRDLLPSEYFQPMYYATINRHCSYKDFTSGAQKHYPQDGERRPPGERISVLKRGTNSSGDKLMKWLENGVFDAVNKGYVAEIQLSIVQDASQPTQVLELYSFTFQYSDSETSSNPSVNVQMNGPRNTKVSLFNARQALNTVIKNMVGLSGILPHLPDRRSVLMHMVYNDRRPSGYEAPGFHRSADAEVSFPRGWALEANHYGKMETGFQTVSLCASYISHPDVPDGRIAVIPEGVQYGPTFSRLDSMNNNQLPVTHEDGPMPHQGTPSVRGLPSNSRIGKDMMAPTPSQLEPDDQEAPALGHRDDQDQEFLRKAQQHSSHGSAQETQKVTQSSKPTPQIEFTEATIKALDGTRSLQLPARATLGRSILDTDSVHCECGKDGQEGEMKFCSFCMKWQHLHCYGYTGSNLAKAPQEHVCYTCLFADQFMDLSEMEYLARVRRILYFLRERDYDSEAQLTNALVQAK